MRGSRAIGIFVVSGLALVGCSEKKETIDASGIDPSNIEKSVTDAVKEQTGRAPSTDTTPCEILSDEFVRAHFDIAADAEITQSPSKYSPHPLCTVSWPKPNAAEHQKEHQAAMTEYMQKKMKGEEVEMPSFRTTDEVSLTLYDPPFDTPAKAMSSFDAAMKRLSDGITASHSDVEVTFQADLTAVEGVGDKAMWAAKMRQLSVVDGDRIFHVTVNTGAELDAEMEKAKAVAKDVAKKL